MKPSPVARRFRAARGGAVLCGALALALASPSLADAQAARWSEDDLLWAGAGALLAGSLLLDRAVDRVVPDGGGTRYAWASDALNHGGRPQYALVALGGAWLGGKLADAPRLSEAAAHVTAALLAAGVANGTLKYSVGRERPNETDRPDEFFPFSAENRYQAFPSGHAVVVFSLASSVSAEARRPWVTVLTYGAATLVGWSRVYDDKHWTSDVVGGALLGIATSQLTLRLLHSRGKDEVSLAVLPQGLAVNVSTP
jgi:membrane-associated phospholipid phosphatase